ncbi:hypothetical protein [Polystyrenella longa]|uniref:hypothetical protein n=1 Tax=Polystyrenella longa TaxID=2528007 RepID=UPI00119DEF15|nr:hypothetical protein [Polystyrenella longa]
MPFRNDTIATAIPEPKTKSKVGGIQIHKSVRVATYSVDRVGLNSLFYRVFNGFELFPGIQTAAAIFFAFFLIFASSHFSSRRLLCRSCASFKQSMLEPGHYFLFYGLLRCDAKKKTRMKLTQTNPDASLIMRAMGTYQPIVSME